MLRIYPVMVRTLPRGAVETAARRSRWTPSPRISTGGSRPFSRRAPYPRAAIRGPTGRAGTRRERARQIELIDEVGRRLDTLVVKPMVYTTLKLMRRPAKMLGMEALQTFLERGFEAFRQMGGAEEFLATIAGRETQILTGFFPGTRARFRTDGLPGRRLAGGLFAKSVSSSSWTARSIEPRSALRRKPSVTVRCRSWSDRTSLPVTPGRSKCSVFPVQVPDRPNFFPRSAASSSAACRAAFMPRW